MNDNDTLPDPWPANVNIGPSHEYPGATTLFRQGEVVESLYLVEDGFVKLSRSERSGHNLIIAVRSRGSLLASAAGLLAKPHAVTAETVTACRLRLLMLADYRRLLKTDLVAQWVQRMHARQVYEQIVLLGELGTLSPRQRLERFLARIIASGPVPEVNKPFRLQLPVKHYELAEVIGVTPEHLSRLFRQLREDGVIRRDKGWLIVADRSPLQRAIRALSEIYR